MVITKARKVKGVMKMVAFDSSISGGAFSCDL